MRYQPMSADFYAGRRRALAATLPKGAVAIIDTAPHLVRSADTHMPYRPDSDFFYLTGVDEPDAVLVLTRDAEWLFVTETNDRMRLWDGDRLTREQAAALSGVADVQWTAALSERLKAVLPGATSAVLNLTTRGHAADPAYHPAHARRRWVRRNFPGLAVASARPQLARLRMIKQPAELTQLRQAAAITAAGFARLRGSGPLAGQHEYQLEARLTAAFMDAGAQGHAYEPIVASGAGSCVLHYIRNDRRIKAGELVLVDAGAEYGWYASDVTRTYPADGRFTARQRAVYEAVLDTQRMAVRLMRPGALLKDIERAVTDCLAGHLVELGVVKPSELADDQAKRQARLRYLPHGLSHFVGLDVHDAGNLRDTPLAAGMVLTCEPGLYLPDEGIGIRLEDDILVTEDGPVNLTEAIPIDPAVITSS